MGKLTLVLQVASPKWLTRKTASKQVTAARWEREQEDVWVPREVQHEYDGVWGGSRGDVQVVAEAQHISENKGTGVRCVSR